MASPISTTRLAAAVARLTGDPGRKCSEGKRYRLALTTADGHKHAISIQVDTHPKETRPYVLNQIADAFKVDRSEIQVVLHDWTPERL